METNTKNLFLLTICEGEPEEEYVKAYLSYDAANIVRKSIRGEYNMGYTIEATNGEIYDVGIIDEITSLPCDINDDDMVKFAIFRETKDYFIKKTNALYWASIAERLSDNYNEMIKEILVTTNPNTLSWLVMENINCIKNRVDFLERKIKEELRRAQVIV